MAKMSIHQRGPVGRPGPKSAALSLALVAAAMVGVYACNDATSPAARANARVAPGVGRTVSVTPGVTTLCKVGPAGTFHVRIGDAAPKAVTVDGGNCATVATINPAAADDVIVSIAEDAASHYAPDHIDLQHGTDAMRRVIGTNTVSFEGAHGAVVTYINNAVVNVCKVGTNGTFQYQIGLNGTAQSLSLSDGQCSTIATLSTATQDDVIVTVRENTSPSYHLDHMILALAALTPRTMTGTNSVSFEGVHGGTVTFYNVPVTATTTFGCTYTQGYYKNKGRGLLPAGNFFLSGHTWLGVLDTAPKHGNAYYILAHQYIAAVINAKTASTTAAVDAALAGAATYFGKATPENWSVNGTYSKSQLTAWADVLDAYNNGATGPGHCGD
jgi:hypothetical protein